jgi:hypothetical protein
MVSIPASDLRQLTEQRVEWFTLMNKEKFAGKVFIELTFWSNVRLSSLSSPAVLTSPLGTCSPFPSRI